MSTLSPSHLEDFFTFLRFPSISTDSTRAGDVQKCAQWLSKKLSSIGLQPQIHPTPGHPVVTARNNHKAGRPTVLIYGHYDVQPVDPLELWTHSPFEPHLENGVVYARGATDNKGQILSHILGVQESGVHPDDLPVNLTFLIEGEEEIGGPNLVPFLEQNRDLLKCDVAVVSDTGMVGPGIPTLTYGLRGIACLELIVTGPDKDLHSGIYGGAVANPLTVLSRIIAGLHDADGHIRIPGFYDGVEPLLDWERESWKKLPLQEAVLRQLTGVPQMSPEKGFSPLEACWSRPTAELNGLFGGYQGEGSKTVIPSRAQAKFSFRLVPGQDPTDVMQKIVAHFREQCPPTVHLEVIPGHTGEPYVVDPQGPYGQAARKALSAAFGGAEPALIREGGSIPVVSDGLKKVLGVDTLLLGLALPDCRIHSPNENFPLANLEAGIRLNRLLLKQLAG